MTEFVSFIHKYRDRLVNHAFYRLGNLEEAEDVVQDVFVKIYTQKLFSNLKTPEQYLYKMTMNACFDFMRKNKLKLQMLHSFEAENQIISEDDVVQNLKMKDEFNRINNILKILPAEQAEVVRFRIIDELSFKEIANILGKSESTIKSRFQYAIKKLKDYEL